ncbi:MAG: epoxide hydrolase N-terminal domain-containing protein, partial [Gemmatimonadetes bacterium]|nr:epoxide hydrolase N-terminal domain-containing protein [Gemmatimonadota bacterium]
MIHPSTGSRLRICALAVTTYLALPAPAHPQAASEAIRPFRVQVPDAVLADLRRRIQATRWPDPETVPDATQGVQLARMQELARYWG